MPSAYTQRVLKPILRFDDRCTFHFLIFRFFFLLSLFVFILARDNKSIRCALCMGTLSVLEARNRCADPLEIHRSMIEHLKLLRNNLQLSMIKEKHNCIPVREIFSIHRFIPLTEGQHTR